MRAKGSSASVREGDTKFGKGLGVIMVDVNGDGKPDIYVANDTVDKFLYFNRTQAGQICASRNCGLASGTALRRSGTPNGSMGVGCRRLQRHRPALALGDQLRERAARPLSQRMQQRPDSVSPTPQPSAGIAVFGRMTVGWGTGFLDIDHHGWEDIFLTTGHATRSPKTSPRAQSPVLSRNRRQRQIQERHGRKAAPTSRATHVGRGAGAGRLRQRWPHRSGHQPHERTGGDSAERGGHEGQSLAGCGIGRQRSSRRGGCAVVLEAGGRKQTRFAKGRRQLCLVVRSPPRLRHWAPPIASTS